MYTTTNHPIKGVLYKWGNKYVTKEEYKKLKTQKAKPVENKKQVSDNKENNDGN